MKTPTFAAALMLSLTGCAATDTVIPVAAVAMPERIHPPEQDLAWVRAYAASHGFSYRPYLEALATLSEFGYRAEGEQLDGYVRVWGAEPQLTIDIKPPYDRAAVMAALAPELRDRVTVREVRYSREEAAAFHSQFDAALRQIGMPEAVASFSHERDRFEITVTSEADAARLRASCRRG